MCVGIVYLLFGISDSLIPFPICILNSTHPYVLMVFSLIFAFQKFKLKLKCIYIWRCLKLQIICRNFSIKNKSYFYSLMSTSVGWTKDLIPKLCILWSCSYLLQDWHFAWCLRYVMLLNIKWMAEPRTIVVQIFAIFWSGSINSRISWKA